MVRAYAKRILRIKQGLQTETGGFAVLDNWPEEDRNWRNRKLGEITEKCQKAGLSVEDRNRLIEEAQKKITKEGLQ